MSGKKIYFEWMRIIAAWLVIYNHSAGYHLYLTSNGIKQGFYMILAIITRINVPLFLMISGSLLLDKEEDFITVIKKRITRFCTVLLFFSLVIFIERYIIALRNESPYEFTINNFVRRILSNQIDGTTPYWYLYAYLGFLLALPFMQRIAKKMSSLDFWSLILLHFIFLSLLPMVNLFLRIYGIEEIRVTGSLSVPFAAIGSLFYPLIGYYMETHIDVHHLTRRKIGLLGILTVVGIALSCFCTFIEGNQTGEYTQNYVSLFDYITSITAFVAIKYTVCVAMPRLSEGKLGKFIEMVGSLTLGIYLLDPFLNPLLASKFTAFAAKFLPTLFVSAGWCFFSMIVGGGLTYIIKKIPLFSKVL